VSDDTITIQFVCPNERVPIATLGVAPGEVVDAQMIREYLDGAPGPEMKDAAAELRAIAKDKTYLMCPRCQAMLLVGLDGQDMETIVADRFVALLGMFRYPDPQHRHSSR